MPQTWILSQSSSQYWKYDSSQFVWHLPRIFLSKECVHTVPLGFTMVSNHTYLKMRVSTECLLHVCHPEIAVPNPFLLMDVFLCINGLRSRMLWWRIAAAVAAAAFEEARNCSLCGGNGFPTHAGSLTFVSKLFESCEPYSWYSTVGLEDSKHRLSKSSSFLRNFWTVLLHPRIIKIHIRRSDMFNDGTCTGWYFLNFSCNLIGQSRRIYSFFVDLSHELFGNEMMLLPQLMSFSITVFCPRTSITTNLYLRTNSSSPKLFLTWRNNSVLSNSPKECTQTSELMDVHQCDKKDFPYLFWSAFFITFFHSLSIVAFASGINISRSERYFIHSFRFPEASVSERQVSRIVWTIRNSRFPNIHICLCVHSPHWCVHPRFAEQNNIWSFYFSLPKFSLEISRTPQVLGLLEEFCPTGTPCPQTRQHALNFHLRNKKIKWRAFFQTFSHWDDFVSQVAILHRILPVSCNINTNEFYFRNFGSCFFLLEQQFPVCMFGNTIFCMEQQFLDSLILVSFSSSGFPLEQFRSTTQILWNPVHDSDRFLFLSTSQ